MGSGNVTAMMFCGARGFIDIENSNIQQNDSFVKPDVAFAKCLTSDNVCLSSFNMCGKYSALYGVCDAVTNYQRAISSHNLIQNGWILHDIESVDSSNKYYIFYKVSSD